MFLTETVVEDGRVESESSKPGQGECHRNLERVANWPMNMKKGQLCNRTSNEGALWNIPRTTLDKVKLIQQA
eukprot:scaffold54618_cov44-Tisochrysis_lutea.AAC.1